MPEQNELRVAKARRLARIEPVEKSKQVSKPGELSLPSTAEGKTDATPLLIVPRRLAPVRKPAPPQAAPPSPPLPARKPAAPPARKPEPPASQPQAMKSDARRALMMRYLSKRYTLLGPLGAGGMGMVFKAKDKLLGMEVAVKAMPPEMTRDSAAAESLKNEAKLAMTLSHDNIVRLYHFDIEKGVMFLVMEYVDGKDFRAILSESGALSAQTALCVAAAMASAIDYAHSRGVLHRDLKPENIMLNRQGVLKVVDFGTARHVMSRGLKADQDYVEGTPVYSPPEQFSGGTLRSASDIYAFCAVMQELLCGLPIFPETVSVDEQMKNPPAELPPGFPSALNDVFRRGLARNPDERWPTAGEFYRQLRAACVSAGLVKDEVGNA